MTRTSRRLRTPIDPGPGRRLRDARLRAGLTQRQLAGDRYSPAYISALEKGLSRPSMVALTYLGARLGIPPDAFLRDEGPQWARMAADLHLAGGDFVAAADAYTTLLETPLSEVERALVLRGRAEARCRLERARDAVGDAAPAMETLVRLGRREDAAYAAYWLAYAHYKLDNTDEARALIGQVLAEVRAGLSIQADFRLRLLVALANIEGWEGRHDRALAYLEEGRGLSEQLDDHRRAAFQFSLALGHAAAGDHEAALQAGTRALVLYAAADADHELASLHNSLALTHLALGATRRARQMAATARRRAEQLGDDRLLAHVLETEAQIALAEGDASAALERAGRTLELARAIGHPHAEASALLTRARAQLLAGDSGSAEAGYREAADLLRQVGPRPRLREALRDWAALLVAQRRHEEAVGVLTEAVND
jgi:transcriptional regulator with XRE-family HTH domain